MNLYDLHPDPKSAPGYATRYDDIPELIWEKYCTKPKELKKREKALAKKARYAYWYAYDILHGPFPAGEAAIAADPGYAYLYSVFVLRRRFPAGEAVITAHPTLGPLLLLL